MKFIYLGQLITLMSHFLKLNFDIKKIIFKYKKLSIQSNVLGFVIYFCYLINRNIEKF